MSQKIETFKDTDIPKLLARVSELVSTGARDVHCVPWGDFYIVVYKL